MSNPHYFLWIPGSRKDCRLILQWCGWRPHKCCKPTEIPISNSENRIWEGSIGRCSATEFFCRRSFVLCHAKCRKVICRRGRKAEQGQTGDCLTCLTGLKEGKGRAELSPQGKGERNMLCLVVSTKEPPLGSAAKPPQPCWMGNRLQPWERQRANGKS